MSDELTKIEARLKRDQDKEHKAKWKQVRTKIRRLKIKRIDKKMLIADSKHCNGDLMEILYQSPQFKSLDDYLDTINAYLSLENAAYDYKGVTLAYMPSKMEILMQVITNQHKIIDRMATLKEIMKE